jgi:hypothetical protein
MRACTADTDCTIHCPSVKGCCGWPCGCTNAIRRDRIGDFDAQYARSCRRAPDCPAMGCAYEETMRARCHQGRCVPDR